jgi:hypothetical protein
MFVVMLAVSAQTPAGGLKRRERSAIKAKAVFGRWSAGRGRSLALNVAGRWTSLRGMAFDITGDFHRRRL